jgi:hypothetical protein
VDQYSRKQTVIHFYMGLFLYRCPNTGHHVQAWSEQEDDFSDCLYLPIKCSVCLRAHLVNPKSGRALGTDDDVKLPDKYAS